MVGVLLVLGTVCLSIGSGGLRRLSSLMFTPSSSGGRANKYENVDTNGLHVLNNAGHHLQPELLDLMDNEIDVVRIKTTEEVRAFLLFICSFMVYHLDCFSLSNSDFYCAFMVV